MSNVTPNNQQGDQQAQGAHGFDRSRVTPREVGAKVLGFLAGAAIGGFVGGCWGVAVGYFTASGDPELYVLEIWTMIVGMAIVGCLVGTIGQGQEFYGACAGVLVLALAPFVLFKYDGWVYLWMFGCGGSGLICGTATGLLVRAILGQGRTAR